MARRSKTLGPSSKTVEAFHLEGAAAHAAYELVRAEGVDALTLRAVAQTCKVDHTALYRHFTDKNALLLAVVGRAFAELIEALREGATRRAFLVAYARFAVEEHHLYAAMFSEQMRANYAAEPLTAHIGELTRLAVERVQGRAPGATISVRDRDAVLRDWALVHGLVDLWRRGLLRAATPNAAIAYIAKLIGAA
jgi:AcrR family transcriptional regulator